ncbi:MAG: Hint domain-containing protein [Pseudomonadota bacterium]
MATLHALSGWTQTDLAYDAGGGGALGDITVSASGPPREIIVTDASTTLGTSLTIVIDDTSTTGGLSRSFEVTGPGGTLTLFEISVSPAVGGETLFYMFEGGTPATGTYTVDSVDGTPSSPAYSTLESADETVDATDGATGGDDTIFGYDGDDTIDAGDGNNSVDGGDGSDVIDTGTGNDTITAGDGDDTVRTGNGTNSVDGGDGNDSILTGSGVDTLIGGIGNDTLDAQGGSDIIEGGEGNDRIWGRGGADSIDGGAGVDDIRGNGGVDTIDGGEGDDTIRGGGGNDIINDTGTIDSDDLIFGQNGNDTIDGGDGNDDIRGGNNDDSLSGGAGDDTLQGQSGVDTLTGGIGADRFVVDGATADTITDFTSSDGDTINLGALGVYSGLEELRDEFDANAGVLTSAGGVTLTGITRTDLTSANTGVVCFAAGTLITTAKGSVPVEKLKVGDLVSTLDNGLQPVRWIARRHLSKVRIRLFPTLRPILIRKDAFGEGRPARDLRVSPQHRMLLSAAEVQIMFGQVEALAHAYHLIDGHRVVQDPAPEGVTYVHFLCDGHELVHAEGLPSETFHPGPVGIETLDDPSLDELLTIFPELDPEHPPFPLARLELKRREVTLLREARSRPGRLYRAQTVSKRTNRGIERRS